MLLGAASHQTGYQAYHEQQQELENMFAPASASVQKRKRCRQRSKSYVAKNKVIVDERGGFNLGSSFNNIMTTMNVTKLREIIMKKNYIFEWRYGIFCAENPVKITDFLAFL